MQLRPGQYSRGPPVTKAQRGEPRLAAREAGTGGCSSEEAMGTLGEPRLCRIARRRRARGALTLGWTGVKTRTVAAL